MKTKQQVKMSTTSVVQTPTVGPTILRQDRAQAAGHGSGGLRYKNEESIQECL